MLLIRNVICECDFECQEECLIYHNKYRMNHNVSMLTFDPMLAVQAQHWADNGVLDTSIWGKTGEGGECWAWGNIFPSWKTVVKTWHDQERNFDWEQYKAVGNNKVGCFQQVVWAGASKIGCGVSYVKGLPFYVAQMDVAGVFTKEEIERGLTNIKKPTMPDLHWFKDEQCDGCQQTSKAF
ncbi:uncharacterized protein [Clytia hemisphaerica]